MAFSARHSVGLVAGVVLTSALSGNIVSASEASPDNHPERYVVRGGTVTFDFNANVLDGIGFGIVPNGNLATALSDDATSVFAIDPSSTLAILAERGTLAADAEGLLRTRGAFLVNTIEGRVVIGNLAIEARSSGALTVWTTLDSRFAPEAVFDITSAMLRFDEETRKLLIVGDVSLVRSWAKVLGLPSKASTVLGAMTIEALIVPASNDQPSTTTCLPEGTGVDAPHSALAASSSDVVVADLNEIRRYSDDGIPITAFAIGTIACNFGNARANWFPTTNQHPLIAQNAYRLKDNRFEQIGMSWPKHGFYAVAEDFCNLGCEDVSDVDPPGTQLGINCSDPYSATLNGQQNNMSPRSTANPHTGYFPFPWPGWEDPAPTSELERRLQVQNVDLDPELNEGARYFIQGHYIHPDDCAGDTQNNNASYREVMATTLDEGGFTLELDGSHLTQRGQAAVRAWQDIDPLVVEQDIPVPGDGLFILAAKVIDLETGFWRFEYALQNLNCDRAGDSFSVPIPDEAIVTNVGFHDIDYHSGDPYDPTDWDYVVTEDSITWSPAGFDPPEDANALRWGIVYNFRFDINTWSDPASITIGLFKPGTPSEMVVETIGPAQSIIDCNGNGIRDTCDLSCDAPDCSEPCGTSIDCDSNLIPDACQPDCNENDVADPCDLIQGTSLNCNNNDIPDECETDCNQNEVPDDCDIADGTSVDCPSGIGNGIPDECEDYVDCNANGLLDSCDIAGETSTDTNGNGIPDECECFPPELPSDLRHQARKHRYISVDPSSNSDYEIGFRVELVEMTRCYGDRRRTCTSDTDCPNVCDNDSDITCAGDAACGGGICEATVPCIHHPDEGLSWWVQDPQQESSGCRLPGGCTDEDWFARLDDAPYFRTWNDFGVTGSSLLHISDCQITPVATYAVSACVPPTGDVCGDPLVIGTILQPPPGNYGDVVGPVDPVTLEFDPPNQILNVGDVSGYLLTNQNYGLPGNPKPQAHWTWVDMEGQGTPFYRPQGILNVGDLNQILFGLQGRPYSWAGNNVDPGDCP
ncbi:MAG: hypothetical protein JSU63_04615 [Phycisphaerales bacterium]|nr:MAG: hypothetical protein JSU63_04615 [Phycisphaerales bacterium]